MVRVPQSALDRLTTGPVPRTDLSAETIAALRESGAVIQERDGEYQLNHLEYGGAAIADGLDLPYTIEYRDSVASTNQIAREAVRDDTTDLVVVAAEQTGGRGRRDRDWVSPPGGIWLSIAFQPTIEASRRSLLTFAGALAVVEAADSIGVAAQIKWPNDVLAPTGDKLAGILTEAGTTATDKSYVVLGIGVNADIPTDKLPVNATSLRAFTTDLDRVELAQTIITTIHRLRGVPDVIRTQWREASTTLGRQVQITTTDTELIGMAVDITDSGALVVEVDGERQTVAVGDCEHLRPA